MDKEAALFIGLYPAGIVYADKRREVHRDWKRVAFMSYRKLLLEVDDEYSDLLPLIKEHAAQIQALKGCEYTVSTCGQTVLLGG
jgi:hypothetical protein